ncbi:MAG TPA: NAD(+)/NADH kinase [Gemmatimonadaceae bacterium]|nr:NAD(+)/NADH kinase [Gemmatimonadaceae bacterium]
MSIRLGVLGHRGYEGLQDVLAELQRLAPQLGLALLVERGLVDDARDAAPLVEESELDVLLTMGGDGTFLRGARFLRGRQIPIAGLNLGRLGFLTSGSRDQLANSLRSIARSEYVVEKRMTLEAHVTDAHGRRQYRWRAVNDVVLHKGGFARVLQLRATVDGEEVARYSADGVIAATPTGSTAYSLSAGGPVVVPTVESILLTPVSPHTLAMRPLVLPPTAKLTLEVMREATELLITVDGQVGATFGAGEVLHVARSPDPILVARVDNESFFFARLREKLGWGGLADRD